MLPAGDTQTSKSRGSAVGRALGFALRYRIDSMSDDLSFLLGDVARLLQHSYSTSAHASGSCPTKMETNPVLEFHPR